MIPTEVAATNNRKLFGPSTPIDVTTSPRLKPCCNSPLATFIPWIKVDKDLLGKWVNIYHKVLFANY